MDGVQWEMRQEAGKDQFKGGWVAKLRKFGILSIRQHNAVEGF